MPACVTSIHHDKLTSGGPRECAHDTASSARTPCFVLKPGSLVGETVVDVVQVCRASSSSRPLRKRWWVRCWWWLQPIGGHGGAPFPVNIVRHWIVRPGRSLLNLAGHRAKDPAKKIPAAFLAHRAHLAHSLTLKRVKVIPSIPSFTFEIFNDDS